MNFIYLHYKPLVNRVKFDRPSASINKGTMLNSTSHYAADTLTDMISTAYICGSLVSMMVIIHIWNRPMFKYQEPELDPIWKITDFIDGDALYERTYPSGKKAWRYKSGEDYVYPRRSDLASFGIHK